MKKIAFILLIVFIGILPASAYIVSYKEQYYKLYHIHYQQYPDDVIENIYWLERAAAADFCNPQYAMAKINNKTDWENKTNGTQTSVEDLSSNVQYFESTYYNYYWYKL